MPASMNATPNQRILLAEDDDAMRVYLERALVNAGYAVDAVDRGTEALPLLKETGYDLLLSDIVNLARRTSLYQGDRERRKKS